MDSWISFLQEILRWIGEWLDYHVNGCLQSMNPLFTILILALVGVGCFYRYLQADRADTCPLRRRQHNKLKITHSKREARHSTKKKHKKASSSSNNGHSSYTTVVYHPGSRVKPERLCTLCKEVIAKRGCSYRACRICCQGKSSSICKAHGTGEQVAVDLVDLACKEKHVQLDVSYTNLKHCPLQLGYVGSQLTSLNLSNNRLASLPLEVGFLRGLQELFLQYNCLEELPECIGNCEKLIELDCKNNQLRRLPASIGNLKNLQVLNLTNNIMTQLPSDIGQLLCLEELCIHSNRLKSLPDTLCNLINLRDLYLGENHKLKELPRNFGYLIRLAELDISSCSLDHLPESLSNCTSLSKVWMSHNKLKYLPSQLGRLHQLKELHVCNNKLRYFPASISYLQLYTFRATNNPLLNEWDTNKCEDLKSRPCQSLPPLQELAARVMVKEHLVSRYHPSLIPRMLREKLKTHRQCSCCGDPFFDYYQSDLCFATVFVFHRLPLYQQICSPHMNDRCSAVNIKQRY